MNCNSWLKSLAVTLAAATVAIAAGCEEPAMKRAQSGQAPTTAPAVAQATDAGQPARPVATAKEKKPLPPANTFLLINEAGVQRMVECPPAKLRITAGNSGGVLAVLYTDDPPAAASRDYTGNSYLFEMKLDRVTRVADLTGASWVHKTDAGGSVAGDGADDADQDKPKDGIFLEGLSRHLQPVNVAVLFEGTPPQMVVKLAGQFRIVANEDRGGLPPTTAVVEAMLPVTIEVDEKAK